MKTATKKRVLGQFFTKNAFWLKPHIFNFIMSTGARVALDPYAGGGDMLEVAQAIGFKKTIGLDIDRELSWKINDGLVAVPKIKDSIIITNPPYLTNYSAKRKGIYQKVEKYFNSCDYDDVYQLAIEKCMTNDFGVMIVPETFINSGFNKNRLVSITIIEDQMFSDTENPVCVICYDDKIKSLDNIAVYKNEKHIGTLGCLEKMRLRPQNNVAMKFNSSNGQIALRAVDSTSPEKPISFMRPEEIDYDLSTIKHSSRLITVIELDLKKEFVGKVIEQSNGLLSQFRERTHDVLLSPFKGNKKNGERRRRLDYMTARSILESAYDNVSVKESA